MKSNLSSLQSYKLKQSQNVSAKNKTTLNKNDFTPEEFETLLDVFRTLLIWKHKRKINKDE